MPKRRPPGDATSRKWSCVKVPFGTVWKGWLMGEPHWIITHWIKPSKPCAWEISGGKMSCICQSRSYPSEWLGYVPIIREDGRCCIVIVHEYAMPALDKIATFSAVKIERSEDRYDSTFVIPSTWSNNYRAERDRMAKPYDAGPFIFGTLFKRSDLYPYYCVWCEEKQIVVKDQCDNSSAADYTPEEQADIEKLRALQAAAKPADELSAGEAVEFHRVMDYMVPHRNGTTKPKPK